MIDPTVAAASISAASNIASTASASATNKKSYKYTRRLMEYQNAWNLEQWNRQNEYNSPSSVMQRYRAAGLNPAMAASGGELNTPASSLEAATPSQFSLSSPVSPDSGSQFMSSLLASAQIDKIDSEVRNTNSQTDKNLLDLLFGKMTFNSRVRGEQGFQLSREKSIDVLNSNLTLQDWELKKRQQDYVTAGITQDVLKSNLPWLKGQEQYRLANIMSDTYMKIASGDKSYKECDKLMTSMLVDYAQIGLMRHQSAYYDSASYANYAAGFNSYAQGNLAGEKAISERDYRNNGGYNPQRLKDIETKAQKELHQFMTETNFKYKKKEWLQNPHAWIQDVNNIAHSVSEFMPWKVSSGGYSNQSFDYNSYGGYGIPSSTR